MIDKFINGVFTNREINLKMLARNPQGKKEEINFKFPNVVKEETRHCYPCNLDYEDTQHLLPSLKLHWNGCPICKERTYKMDRKFYVQQFIIEKQSEANKMRHETEQQENKNTKKKFF